MPFLFFIPFLIILFVWLAPFFYLQGKINKLEQKINKLVSGTKEANLGTTNVNEVVQSQTPTQPFTVSPLQSSQPQTASQPQPASQMPKKSLSAVSSEEIGGRWLGKVGLFAVLIGIALFLQYAFANNWVGPTGRVAIGILAGILFLGVGHWMRPRYTRWYSDILMGGGIAILYLTTFTATYIYLLLTKPVALIVLIAITVLSVVLSVVEDAMSLAIIGILGGFITPYLMTTSKDDMILLFLYVCVLDLGILAISVWRKWIKLNYLGFLGTLFTFLVWFFNYYSPSDLSITMFFLSAYFVIFLLVTIVHHLLRKEKTQQADLLLLTINALAYFGMSYILLYRGYHQWLGYFALALAVLYFIFAAISQKTDGSDKMLNFYLPALSVVFLSIAIPLQLNGNWITLAWLIESLVLYWLSFTISNKNMQFFGGVVYVVGVIRILFTSLADQNITPIFNYYFAMAVIAVLIAYIVAWLYVKNNATTLQDGAGAKKIVSFFIIAASIITVYSGTVEINRYYLQQIDQVRMIEQAKQKQAYNYGSAQNYNYNYALSGIVSDQEQSLNNQQNLIIILFWTLYAILLMFIGFMRRSSIFRILSLILFFITAVMVFIDLWALGQVYRIVGSIVFGIIALAGSFLYARFKGRIKEIL